MHKDPPQTHARDFKARMILTWAHKDTLLNAQRCSPSKAINAQFFPINIITPRANDTSQILKPQRRNMAT